MRRYEDVMKMFPTSLRPYVDIGLLEEHQGRLREATAEYRKLMKTDELPDDVGLLSTLGHLYAKLGRRTEALAALSRLQVLSQQRSVSPCEFAAVHGALGDKDAAFRSLDQYYEDRSWEIILLKLDTAFAELRGDPRYDAMVHRLTL